MIKRSKKKRNALIGLITAIIAGLTALLAYCDADGAEPGLMAGCSFGDGRPAALIGITYSPSPNAGVFAVGDLDNYDETINVRAMFNLQLIDQVKLHLLSGPEVEFQNNNPGRDDAVTYLALSTGLAVSWRPADRLSIWAAIDYASNATRPGQPKFGIGIVSWLGSP